MAYRQCYLVRGVSRQVSWIPEKYAKMNKTIRVKDEDGNWDNGWVVQHVGRVRLEHDQVMECSRAFRYQRKASDI